MKIAIFTQPLRTNYGGILQAYAMQSFLQKCGHSVVVINRENDFKLSPYLLFLRVGSFIKCLINRYILRRKEFVVTNPFSPFYHTKWTGYEIQPFVKKYINQSDPIFSSKNLRKYLEQNKFDCFVVGSDQVWRPCYSPCITDFFLKEIPLESEALKIAYAASFGTDKWEFTEEETKECAELAKKFDAVSVREESGIALCKDYFGVEAEHLLDPTMLLCKEEYIRLLGQANVSKSKGTLFSYVLDENVEANLIVESLRREGYVPNYASTSVTSTSANLRPYQLSVEEWLRGIYDAEFVVTDSFHACVFSILFKKPFVALGNRNRGNARFHSLLKMFGLTDRLVITHKEFLEQKNRLLLFDDVENLDSMLAFYRQRSIVFLEQHMTYC